MSDFAARNAQRIPEDGFRPVWQVESTPFRLFENGAAPSGATADPQADEGAEDDFAEQLADSYRRGFADGQAAIGEANADLRAASEQLAHACDTLKAQPGDMLAETMLRTVRNLIEKTAGFSQPDAAMLEDHCQSLAALARKECANAVLHIHPDDRVLLDDTEFGVPLQDDPSLTRGTLSLAHADGWIEQGVQSMLDEIDTMIEALESAR